MSSVVQRPDTLSLLRNIKSYRINSSSAVAFKLMKGTSVLIEETYHPDGTDIVTIDIQDVVAQYLSLSLPSTNIYSIGTIWI